MCTKNPQQPESCKKLLTLPGIAVHRPLVASSRESTEKSVPSRTSTQANKPSSATNCASTVRSSFPIQHPNLKESHTDHFTVNTVEFSRVADTSQYQVWDFLPPSPRAYTCSHFQFHKQRVIIYLSLPPARRSESALDPYLHTTDFRRRLNCSHTAKRAL